MKSKRIVLQALILSILIVFATAVSDSTFATANQDVEVQKIPERESARAHTWHTCEVTWVGPGWGNIYIRLTDQGGAFSNRWFIARTDQKKEMLATGLTAMSNNIKVFVALSGTTEYSEILAFYLMH